MFISRVYTYGTIIYKTHKTYIFVCKTKTAQVKQMSVSKLVEDYFSPFNLLKKKHFSHLVVNNLQYSEVYLHYTNTSTRLV